MRYVIRPAYTSYASTISGCGNGCTDSVNFPGQCNYKGIDSTSCQNAKDIYNKRKPAGTIHAPAPATAPVVTTPLPSRFPNTVNLSTGGDKAIPPTATASDSHGKSAHDRAQPAAAPPPPTSADNTPNVTPSSTSNDTSSCPSSSDCSGALDLQCQFNKIVCPLANQFNIPQGLLLPGAIGIIILLTMVFIIRR